MQQTVTLYMSIVGFLSGLYALWISHRNMRQVVCITTSETQKDWFQVTNHSLRPIPIQSVTLFCRRGKGMFMTMGDVKIIGIQIPGVLPPESSFEMSYYSLEQIVDTIIHDVYYLELKTQTGQAGLTQICGMGF